jgi:hypothetical protein
VDKEMDELVRSQPEIAPISRTQIVTPPSLFDEYLYLFLQEEPVQRTPFFLIKRSVLVPEPSSSSPTTTPRSAQPTPGESLSEQEIKEPVSPIKHQLQSLRQEISYR